MSRETQHIYVVCGEAGEPQRAYHSRENAEALLEHWQNGAMNVEGSIRTIDLVTAGNGDKEDENVE